MIDTTQLQWQLDFQSTIFFLFLMVLIIVCALSLIFRDRIAQWDKKMATKLDGIMKQQVQSEEVAQLMPVANYQVQRLTPDGGVLEQEHFICSAHTLEAAIDGVVYLKELAKEKKQEEENDTEPNPLSM